MAGVAVDDVLDYIYGERMSTEYRTVALDTPDGPGDPVRIAGRTLHECLTCGSLVTGAELDRHAKWHAQETVRSMFGGVL